MRITIIGAGPGGYETALAVANKGIEFTTEYQKTDDGRTLNEEE